MESPWTDAEWDPVGGGGGCCSVWGGTLLVSFQSAIMFLGSKWSSLAFISLSAKHIRVAPSSKSETTFLFKIMQYFSIRNVQNEPFES